jgi:ABC-type lipoprotein export system ATPase subunit
VISVSLYTSVLWLSNESSFTRPPINNLSYKVKDGDEEKMLLNNISISFEMPELITISGPSGSGKTTFLYAISGMLDNLTDDKMKEKKFYNH